MKAEVTTKWEQDFEDCLNSVVKSPWTAKGVAKLLIEQDFTTRAILTTLNHSILKEICDGKDKMTVGMAISVVEAIKSGVERDLFR